MTRLIDVLNRCQLLPLFFACLCLAALPVIMFYDVVARYLFNAPTIWANEIALYLLQFLVFLTAGSLTMGGEHVRVTFWIERLRGRPRLLAEAATAALIIPYAGVLVWYGLVFTSNAYRRELLSPTLLEVPLWIPYGLIPLGGGLLALAAATRVAALLIGSPAQRNAMLVSHVDEVTDPLS